MTYNSEYIYKHYRSKVVSYVYTINNKVSFSLIFNKKIEISIRRQRGDSR